MALLEMNTDRTGNTRSNESIRDAYNRIRREQRQAETQLRRITPIVDQYIRANQHLRPEYINGVPGTFEQRTLTNYFFYAGQRRQSLNELEFRLAAQRQSRSNVVTRFVRWVRDPSLEDIATLNARVQVYFLNASRVGRQAGLHVDRARGDAVRQAGGGIEALGFGQSGSQQTDLVPGYSGGRAPTYRSEDSFGQFGYLVQAGLTDPASPGNQPSSPGRRGHSRRPSSITPVSPMEPIPEQEGEARSSGSSNGHQPRTSSRGDGSRP